MERLAQLFGLVGSVSVRGARRAAARRVSRSVHPRAPAGPVGGCRRTTAVCGHNQHEGPCGVRSGRNERRPLPRLRGYVSRTIRPAPSVAVGMSLSLAGLISQMECARSSHLVTKLHHTALVGFDLRQMEGDVFVQLLEEWDPITNQDRQDRITNFVG